MKRICFTCNREFKSRNNGPGRGKYCSMKCRSEQRKHPKIPCPTCREMFHPNRTHEVYCSKKCVQPPNKLTDPIDRFWSQVDKTTSPNGCWIWFGFKVKGYGKFSVFIENKWKSLCSHRYAAELTLGYSILGQPCLHNCDNPSCVRFHSEHVSLGTQKKNMEDKVSKNRQAKGEKIGTSKLTEEQVKEIRRRLSNGELGFRLAQIYNVRETNISSIKLKKTWRHIL